MLKLKISEIGTVKGGKRLPLGSNLQKMKNSHPYIKVNSLNGRIITVKDFEYVPDNVFEKISSYIVNTGDLVLSVVGTVGLVSYIDEKLNNASLTENCVKISGLNFVDSQYLYYYLISTEGQAVIRSYTVGSTQPKLPMYNIRNIEIPWGDEHYRRKVTKILLAIDKKIEANVKINTCLEDLAKLIFKSWFVDFDPVYAKKNALEAGLTKTQAERAAMAVIAGLCSPTEYSENIKGIEKKLEERLTSIGRDKAEELKTTASLFPNEFEDSEIGAIPKGSKVTKISDFMELAYGKALKKEDRVDGNYNVYGSGGITGTHTSYLVDGPGIIVGRKGTVGSLFWENSGFYPIDTAYYVKPKQHYSLNYLYQLLKTLGLETMNTDTSVPGLNRENAYRLKVLSFSSDIVAKFTKLDASIRAKIFCTNNESKALIQLRDTLLPRLLAGEINLENVHAESGAP